MEDDPPSLAHPVFHRPASHAARQGYVGGRLTMVTDWQPDERTIALVRDAIIKSIDARHPYEWFQARKHFTQVIDNLLPDIDRKPKWLAIVDGRGRHIDFISPDKIVTAVGDIFNGAR